MEHIEKKNFSKGLFGYIIGFLLSGLLYINPVFHFFVVINIFIMNKKAENVFIHNIFKAVVTSYFVTIVFAYITLMFIVMGYFSK